VISASDSIFTLSLSGRTGICSTQEEYLTKLQNGRLEKVENLSHTDYEELQVQEKGATATSAFVTADKYVVSLLDGYDGELGGYTFQTDSGIIEFEC
jgi:hypothetical protein